MELIMSAIGYAFSFVLGYLASYLVAKQTMREKKLQFKVIERDIIFEDFTGGDLTILYKGNNVKNLYMVVVRLWNRGKEQIIATDISSKWEPTIRIGEDARFLGKPIIKQANEKIGTKLTRVESNSCSLRFECLNYDEWIELVFFYSGNLYASVTTDARIYGQNYPICDPDHEKTLGLPERVSYLFASLFISLSPVFLVISLAWYWYLYPTYEQFLDFNKKVPALLKTFWGFGMVLPIMYGFFKIKLIAKRKKYPKGYMLEEDLMPSPWAALESWWKMGITGKKYYLSNSIYSLGEMDNPKD